LDRTGGPEVLQWEEVSVGEPGEGQARVRHTAIGVNFVDTYQRSGLYPVPVPGGLGSEGAGVVEAVGPGVTQVHAGDRVAYAGGPPGAYAEVRLMPADRLLKLPEGIPDPQAAAMMLKGMTVQYLIRRTYKVQPGDTVLFHAAAGGVGLIACQWLKALGATVIGTVGSDDKAELARAHGCDHTIVYTREDFAGSLDCLRPLGLMVSFGNASGPVPPFEPAILSQKGSLYLTRPTLATYTASRADLEATARDLFDVVLTGKVKVEVRHTYALKDARQVHEDLESRKTTGSIVMLP
jgi:NADPH2:quinone reductase